MKTLIVTLISVLLLNGCITDSPDNNMWSVPERVDLHTRLGLAYLNQELLNAAQEELVYALVLGPENSRTQHAMALLQLKLGDRDSAGMYFRQSIEGDSGNYLARNDFGTYLCQQGKRREGIEHLQFAVEDPFNVSRHLSHYRIGVCLSENGDFEAASGHLSKALQMQPTSRPVLYEAAVASFNLGRHLSARGFLERYFEGGDPSAESLFLAVNNERKLGSESLVGHYAYLLRTTYPASTQAQRLKTLLGGDQSG